MKNLTILTLTILLISAVQAAPSSKKCGENFKKISCSKVKNSTRENFCWKGKISKAKRDQICKSKKRK